MIEQATSGRYLPVGSSAEADCVLGFSFGYRVEDGRITPGISNSQIADFAKKYSLPKIFQFEIADAYAEQEPVERISENRSGGYLDTYEVALQARDLMTKKGYKQAILLAHPYHIPRASAICSKAGIEHSIPPGLEVIQFDPLSAQDWTQSSAHWNAKEPGVIRRSKELGYI